jgi:glycosyltransferase involved in cell wall biosynthesis
MKGVNSLVLIDSFDAFTKKYLNLLLSEVPNTNSVEVYGNTEWRSEHSGISYFDDITLSYKVRTASPSCYTNFLDYAFDKEENRIVISRLRHFELFVLDLISRPSFDIPISLGMYGLNEILGSRIREYSVKQFLSSNHENRIILHSNGWNSPATKEWLVESDLGDLSNQIFLVADPIYESADQYLSANSVKARQHFDLLEDKFYVLFFGSLFFGKGIDLMIEAANHINSEVRILIVGSSNTLNVEIETEKFTHAQIRFIDQFTNDDELGLLFCAVDVVALPYRKGYSHGTSGVLVQAGLAKKPILVPDFEPFRSIIDSYKVGLTFSAEDVRDIGLQINNLWHSQSHNKPGLAFEWSAYIKQLTPWTEIYQNYFEENNLTP